MCSARRARAAGLKVVLSGEGADELFGGYARYRRATLPFVGGRDGGKSGVFDAVPALARAFDGWSAGFDAIAHAAPGRARLDRLDRLQALDCEERLPNSLLVKLDRCLMANSVEGRTPFLDREVAGFAAALPQRLRANPRHGKVLLRHWLAAHAPETKPFARKRGFNPPVGRWMHDRREVLAGLVAREPGVAAFADSAIVAKVFEAAREAPQPAWSLLYYALWHATRVLERPSEGDIGDVLGG